MNSAAVERGLQLPPLVRKTKNKKTNKPALSRYVWAAREPLSSRLPSRTVQNQVDETFKQKARGWVGTEERSHMLTDWGQ